METAQIPETLRHLVVPLASLRPHPQNPRCGDVEAIKVSLLSHGQYRPIVVRRHDNMILAGHHVMQAAGELGWAEIAATFVDVDDEEAARIVLVDNRTNDLARYDEGLLSALLADMPSLDGTGWDQPALDELLERVNQASGAGLQGDPDAVPDVPAEPTSKRGDIWQCGRHRVMCGDATDSADVATLLAGMAPDLAFNDPPYGIEIVQAGWVGGGAAYQIPFGGVKNRQNFRGTDGASKPFGSKDKRVGTDGADHVVKAGIYAPVIGDDSTHTARTAYVLCAALNIPVLIFWGGNYYATALPDSPCWLVWDKENTGNFADAELAWTNQKTAVRVFRHMWNGMVKASEHGEKRTHPTQKPVALAEWCFEQYGKSGDTVLDLFLGSGMALIAAERTNRTLLGMELAPEYVDVSVRRWEAVTDQQAERLSP